MGSRGRASPSLRAELPPELLLPLNRCTSVASEDPMLLEAAGHHSANPSHAAEHACHNIPISGAQLPTSDQQPLQTYTRRARVGPDRVPRGVSAQRNSALADAPDAPEGSEQPFPPSPTVLNRDATTPAAPSPTAPQSSPGSLAAAKAKTAAFLSSIRLALQMPLSDMPPAVTNTATTQMMNTPRRSDRLASKPLNVAVRPSRKGEILAMKKLGVISNDARRGRQHHFKRIRRIPFFNNATAALCGG